MSLSSLGGSLLTPPRDTTLLTPPRVTTLADSLDALDASPGRFSLPSPMRSGDEMSPEEEELRALVEKCDQAFPTDLSYGKHSFTHFFSLYSRGPLKDLSCLKYSLKPCSFPPNCSYLMIWVPKHFCVTFPKKNCPELLGQWMKALNLPTVRPSGKDERTKYDVNLKGSFIEGVKLTLFQCLTFTLCVLEYHSHNLTWCVLDHC